MTMSALVVTLAGDAPTRARTIASLARDPRLHLGAHVLDRLPVVTETADAADGARLHDELAATPGLLIVDLVSVELEEVA